MLQKLAGDDDKDDDVKQQTHLCKHHSGRES